MVFFIRISFSINFNEEKVNFLRNHPEFEYCYGKSIIVDENEPENNFNPLFKAAA